MPRDLNRATQTSRLTCFFFITKKLILTICWLCKGLAIDKKKTSDQIAICQNKGVLDEASRLYTESTKVGWKNATKAINK